MGILFVALDDYKPDPGGVAQLTHVSVGALHDQGHHVEALEIVEPRASVEGYMWAS